MAENAPKTSPKTTNLGDDNELENHEFKKRQKYETKSQPTKQTRTPKSDGPNSKTKPQMQLPQKQPKPPKPKLKNANLIPLEDEDDAASDVSTENFNLGERVLLDGKTKAQVAYFGPVGFSHDDDWVGIVFEEPVGKHNGTVAGTEYFKCDTLHGIFVRSHRLHRTDSSGMVTARVKSPYRVRPKSSASGRSMDLEMEEDIFTKADQTDPLGFYEARAGTLRSPEPELNSKLGRMVEEIDDGGDQMNFASPWIHSSRTPTPTSAKYISSPSARKLPTKKVASLNKSSKPYGITMGFGEMD